MTIGKRVCSPIKIVGIIDVFDCSLRPSIRTYVGEQTMDVVDISVRNPINTRIEYRLWRFNHYNITNDEYWKQN